MRFSRSRLFASLTVCLGLAAAQSAPAAIYTDATGDNTGGPEVDIASVVVTNDANNITFQINMNSAANLATNHFANYEVGIQEGGGEWRADGHQRNLRHGNSRRGKSLRQFGRHQHRRKFLHRQLPQRHRRQPRLQRSAQLYQYSSSGGSTQVSATAPITEVATGSPSTAFSFPLRRWA